VNHIKSFRVGDHVRYNGPMGNPAIVVVDVPDHYGEIVVAWHGSRYGTVHPNQLVGEP
jgi:hypothetical protein